MVVPCIVWCAGKSTDGNVTADLCRGWMCHTIRAVAVDQCPQREAESDETPRCCFRGNRVRREGASCSCGNRDANQCPERIVSMKLESAVRIMAGTMVLVSLALAHWVNQWWLLLTVFVGVNLIQSALTGFCPAELILKKLGIGQGDCCAGSAAK